MMKRSLFQPLKRIWHIVRDVLRGYTTGQPPDEERPRKSCC